MALEYKLLPDELRRALWDMFFEMYEENDRNIKFGLSAKKLVTSPEVTAMNLNGRAIRNGRFLILSFNHTANCSYSHSSIHPSCSRRKEKRFRR